MADVLSITGVIFLLIGLGWALARAGLLDGPALKALGGYVVTCALPALIFRAVSSRPVAETFDPAYLIALTFASLTLFAAGYLLLRRRLAATPAGATFGAMGMACANSGFVGFPMLQLALPALAGHALALNMMVENLLMIPLVLALAEAARDEHQGGEGRRAALAASIAKRLAGSPILLALLAALLVASLRLPMPALVTRPVALLAESSPAVSLIVIGGALAGLKPGHFGARAWLVTGGKLLALPALAAAALWALAQAGLSPRLPGLGAALILICATPTMTITPVLARSYGEETEPAVALFLQTLLSFVTLTALLALLGLPGG